MMQDVYLNSENKSNSDVQEEDSLEEKLKKSERNLRD